MANLYVRSSTGSDANNGTTWALAKATIGAAATIAAAGDVIWVRSDHSETAAAPKTITLPGTITSPNRVQCTADATEPPTSTTTGAVVATTASASAINISGSCYVYGITFDPGTGGAVSCSLALNTVGTAKQIFDTCDMTIRGTGASSWIQIGPGGTTQSGYVTLNNCRYKFGNAANGLSPNCPFEINGGSIISGSASINNLFNSGATNRVLAGIVTGLDLTNLNASANLVIGGGAIASSGTLTFRGITLPASWSGLLCSTAQTLAGQRFELFNKTLTWIEDVGGRVKTETTVVKTGGSSDGTTPVSWKLTTNATNAFPSSYMQTPEVVVWNDNSGGSKTLTWDFVHDSLTNLKDNEVGVRVYYPNSATTDIYGMADSAPSVVATAADLAASTATFTTTGLTNPNKQKVTRTFTPLQKGPCLASLVLFKASKTVFADIKPAIT